MAGIVLCLVGRRLPELQATYHSLGQGDKLSLMQEGLKRDPELGSEAQGRKQNPDGGVVSAGQIA